MARLGPSMFDLIRIQPEPLHLGASATVIGVVHGVVQKKFGAPPGCIDLDRNHLCGPYQDSLFVFFRND